MMALESIVMPKSLVRTDWSTTQAPTLEVPFCTGTHGSEVDNR